MLKVDGAVSVATAALVASPMTWIDVSVKVVPAALISLYWVLRIIQHQSQKKDK